MSVFNVKEQKQKDRARSEQRVTHLPIFFHTALHNAATPFDVEYGWPMTAL